MIEMDKEMTCGNCKYLLRPYNGIPRSPKCMATDQETTLNSMCRFFDRRVIKYDVYKART